MKKKQEPKFLWTIKQAGLPQQHQVVSWYKKPINNGNTSEMTVPLNRQAMKIAMKRNKSSFTSSKAGTRALYYEKEQSKILKTAIKKEKKEKKAARRLHRQLLNQGYWEAFIARMYYTMRPAQIRNMYLPRS